MPKYRLRYFKNTDAGLPLLFADMTALGPRMTDDPAEARTFDSEQDAMEHPAFSDPLCLLEPEQVCGTCLNEGGDGSGKHPFGDCTECGRSESEVQP